MITPTVGRVVWFWPYTIDEVQPLAATIAYVHSDTLVNLTVHDRSGETYGLTSVTLWHGEGDTPVNPFCEWMPYQKGQAVKTESLERQLENQAAHPPA